MKKIENRNNEYIAQLIDTTPCHVSPLSYASNPKIILLKLGAYSFAWCLLFIVTKRISNWHNGSENFCEQFWRWQLLLEVLRFYCNYAQYTLSQVGVSLAFMQVVFSAVHYVHDRMQVQVRSMQVTVSSIN